MNPINESKTKQSIKKPPVPYRSCESYLIFLSLNNLKIAKYDLICIDYLGKAFLARMYRHFSMIVIRL